ncbi:MAG: polyprenyl synthetase family protein [Ignavibacteriaceae bacterium]|nr:polyprenyl synthetase family protein [Ignavibacteriaceae bacterium]
MGSYETKFKKFLNEERKIVEKKLSEALKNRKPDSLYKPGYYIIEGGGKRLRPLLVLMAAKAVGGKLKKAYNAAAAVELLHNFTLVHDDIMDNADKRRNILTVHKKYDMSTAILAGDSLLSIAYEYLLKDCNGTAKKVLSAFTKGLVEVCEGQSLDKEFEIRKAVTIDEYIEMIEKKTAAMIEMCCTVGALLGGGSAKEIKNLADFGKNIGIAFQIQDDLLDITGNENDFGKLVGGDLVEGKKTFLFLKALEVSKGTDKKKLLEVVNNKGIKPEQIQNYKDLYQKLNILEEAEKEIRHYTNLALKSVKKIRNEEYRVFFGSLADSLIKRKK